ncbi:MAG: TorF family putative porin, partial [Xanthomonadales bacterium]|nr:TorF family putative porin [Xanthomonadales bacterium]
MRYRLITAALLAALSMPALAQDAEEESGPLAFNVGIVSDYVFRGVSQTNEGPAFQAGMDYTHDSGFHAGVWA